MKKIYLFSFLMFFFTGASAFQAKPGFASPSVAGTYRCWMFNVGGAGGNCPVGSPPFILNANGTYRFSSETGTYRVSGNLIYFSHSSVRGPGHLANGNQIFFNYTYQGLPHSVTYLRQGGPPPSTSNSSTERRLISVQIHIHFNRQDGVLGWINTGKLVPEGSGTSYDGIAFQQDSLTIQTSFRNVQTGTIYTLYLGTGTTELKIGQVDLRKAMEPTTINMEGTFQ